MENVDCCCEQDFGVVILNNWIFHAHHTCLEYDMLRHNDTAFVCSRTSGPSDYHAEWRFYPQESKYKLLVSSYDSKSVNEGNTHVVKELHKIGDVMMYCAQNMHPLKLTGTPLHDTYNSCRAPRAT